MPLKRHKIICRPCGKRGQAHAREMIDLMKDNWDKIQEVFYQQLADEQDEMIDLFNAAIENCGDNLFSEDTMPEDFEKFILRHPEGD